MKYAFAKNLRQTGTPTEEIMWKRLRNRQVQGLKFRRQQPIGPYIVDFYCAEINLIIEIDGDVHCIPSQVTIDQQRQQFLLSRGYTILRFTTNEVLKNIEGILELLVSYPSPHPYGSALQASPTAAPLPQGER